ncbi:MAG TPA: hypothetical protein VFP84_16165, partial [Kofleriaceae bacterium]|nr:hypothetical protein [Kofleriaceae bacterium]
GGVGGGGDGSLGRVRLDLPTLDPRPGGAVRRGAMFDPKIPTVTRNPREPINLVSQTAADDAWQVIVTDGNNATTATSTIKFATDTAVYTPALSAGYNKICVLPPAGELTLEESTNCLEIVYVP